MKQNVYYLYEYHENQQIRNVGFVKCQHKGSQAVFQIHGKGLACPQGQEYEMNLFSEKNEMCYISRAGHVETEVDKINYMVTVNEVGEELFEDYDGLYIHVEENKRYVAMWTPKKAAFHKVVSYTGDLEEELAPPVDVDLVEEELERVEDVEQSIESPRDKQELTEQVDCLEEGMEEVEGLQEHIIEAEECCYDAIRKRKEQEAKKDREEQIKEVEVKEHYHDKRQITYDKIERQDIAKLPQREWRLANNSFLLHGHHNYLHILFIQEAGRSFIGVPGVYSAREADVAKSFGFPVFHRVEPGQVQWDEGECDLREDFGYWCKEVSYRVGR